MRIRIRGPSGQSTISLGDDAVIKDLKSSISENTSLPNFDVKYGYPPKPLLLDQYESTRRLLDLDIKLGGEQLIVTKKEANGQRGSTKSPSVTTTSEDLPESKAPSSVTEQKKSKELVPESSTSASASAGPSNTFSFEGFGSAPPPSTAPPVPLSTKPTLRTPESKKPTSNKPPSLTRKKDKMVENDPPEIPLPQRAGTLVLRIMPDDNSCLFRAVGTAVLGDAIDTMTELRSIVAQTIQADPETYSAAVLEQKPDDYCIWIQTEDAWGGGIELSILSKHFDLEICSIDVQSLRIDRFNEGRPTRCILVYSGIHYDCIAFSSSEPPYTKTTMPPEFDEKIFDSNDDVMLAGAVALCKILQGRHYYTDTKGFSIRCNTCGGMFVGEKGATEHASQTGHYDFGEAS